MVRRLWDAVVGGLILTLFWYGYRAIYKGQFPFDGGVGGFAMEFAAIWLGVSLFVLVAVMIDARLRGKPDGE